MSLPCVTASSKPERIPLYFLLRAVLPFQSSAAAVAEKCSEAAVKFLSLGPHVPSWGLCLDVGSRGLAGSPDLNGTSIYAISLCFFARFEGSVSGAQLAPGGAVDREAIAPHWGVNICE